MAGYYAQWIGDELADRPLDRALLAGFAEMVQEADAGPIADIGCGPGRVTAHLDGLGVPAFGIDLSPQMVAQARRAYSDLRFDVGSMLDLDLPDRSLGGIVTWYSIIHVPDEELPRAFAEFGRVLAPGGYVLAAFQVGDEVTHRAEAAGQSVSLDFYLRRPSRVAGMLNEAGFVVQAQVLREPDGGGRFPEKTQQRLRAGRQASQRCLGPAGFAQLRSCREGADQVDRRGRRVPLGRIRSVY